MTRVAYLRRCSRQPTCTACTRRHRAHGASHGKCASFNYHHRNSVPPCPQQHDAHKLSANKTLELRPVTERSFYLFPAHVQHIVCFEQKVSRGERAANNAIFFIFVIFFISAREPFVQDWFECSVHGCRYTGVHTHENKAR